MIKQAIKVGNGAGILLSREYLGSLVEVRIITPNEEKIKKQILEKVNPHLENIMGIYLVGSYARKEEREDSDIDILIISNKKLQIHMENYHIICLNYDELLKEMEKSIIEYYPMLLEAKTILNGEILKSLLIKPITKENLKWHIDSTKSALKIVREALATEDKDLIVNDAIIYSLMLRLREIYLADCILDRKIGNVKGLIRYSERIKSIEKLYNTYRKLRDDKKVKIEVEIGEIKECYEFAKEKLENQERKINELKK